ncbi:AIPR family protein [Paludibacter jiangxiensis]|uniref:AIPR protein n=1 Tax=Paludibacter jiangxiensis TaxID=681398 RepID=A0A171AM05_9BACT|nr:AIPR family protein [Paludibacter jiangxiensis]GAT63959.1 AIPR protein [Paludibacter jiangxiensis]
MSILHISRIKTLLENQVFQHVNLDQIKIEKPKISADELENICLTQSYLLYALKSITGLDYSELSDCIVDNFKDNGIDAILYSKKNNTLYICQSKFNKRGTCSVDKGEILKFLEGINDLLALDFSKFNSKVNSLKENIELAIYSANIRIQIVLIHSGNMLACEIKDLILNKIELLNDTDEVIFFKEFSLVEAYNFLKDSVSGEPINIELDLSNWGINEEPYKSYYGTVNCGSIAELAQNNPKRLFSKNLRSFIGLNSVNYDIVKSIIKTPEHFFYLNNGIVLLCKHINKSPFNSGKRDIGKFKLLDVSVINGAQTVGSIKHAFDKQPERVTNASVFVKIISLENTPKDFDKHITIASNTQNRIEKRDFISLDEQQSRLINEFFLNNLVYHVKRDELIEKKNETNYYFEEATVSLAGFQENVDYSTYAKREIGKLWEDDFYKTLFNKDINVIFLVNIIKVFREIEKYIKTIDDNSRNICFNGMYLISNIIYAKHRNLLLNPNVNIAEFINNTLANDIKEVCQKLVIVYNTRFSVNRIPLSSFKNFNLCREIKETILEIRGTESVIQTSLFDSLDDKKSTSNN